VRRYAAHPGMTQFMSSDRTDDQLLSRARAGDVRALGVLFDRHATDMHALVFRFLGSADDADDVVQDLFVGLPTALNRYAGKGRFEAWLRQVATRMALMRLRGDRRRTAAAYAAPMPGNVEPRASDPPLASALNDAILRLPPTTRAVFVLRMIEEYDYEDIARELNRSVGACKVQLHRALKRLRPQLQHLREDHDE
jgi:RNA polymerase sigma-70 factor (ECF subfamily)